MPHADVAFQGKVFEPWGSLIAKRIFQGKDEGIIKTALAAIRPPERSPPPHVLPAARVEVLLISTEVQRNESESLEHTDFSRIVFRDLL